MSPLPVLEKEERLFVGHLDHLFLRRSLRRSEIVFFKPHKLLSEFSHWYPNRVGLLDVFQDFAVVMISRCPPEEQCANPFGIAPCRTIRKDRGFKLDVALKLVGRRVRAKEVKGVVLAWRQFLRTKRVQHAIKESDGSVRGWLGQ